MCPAGTYWNAPTNCHRPQGRGRYKKGELLMSKKKLGIGIAAVAAAGAGAAALTVKNHNKAKVQKDKAAAEHAEYRNTERGKHEKNRKGIYYTNGNYEARYKTVKEEHRHHHRYD